MASLILAILVYAVLRLLKCLIVMIAKRKKIKANELPSSPGKKSRIFLLLISPLMLLILLIGVIFIGDAVLEYQRIQRFADNEALERITGAPFPKLKVVEFKEGKVSFNGDFTDNWVVKMKDGAGESLFLYLDSVANKKGTNWFKDDEKYFYNRIWGNGYPAPNGEDDEEDRFLHISLKKDCNTIIIQSGMW